MQLNYTNTTQDLSGYWTKIYRICSRGVFIDDVNVTIRVAIRPQSCRMRGATADILKSSIDKT